MRFKRPTRLSFVWSAAGLLAASATIFGVAASAPAQASPMPSLSGPALNALQRAPSAVRALAFAAPVRGVRVNSVFGLRRLSAEKAARMHEGVDYAAPQGTPVLAAAHGRVVAAGASPSYGRFVELAHPNGVTSFYAHLSRVASGVAVGATLAEGDAVGAVGSTGRSTGAHLHFEIRQAGRKLDPQSFIGRSFALNDLPSVIAPRPGLIAASGVRSYARLSAPAS